MVMGKQQTAESVFAIIDYQPVTGYNSLFAFVLKAFFPNPRTLDPLEPW